MRYISAVLSPNARKAVLALSPSGRVTKSALTRAIEANPATTEFISTDLQVLGKWFTLPEAVTTVGQPVGIEVRDDGRLVAMIEADLSHGIKAVVR
jgi:hypothetical protein